MDVEIYCCFFIYTHHLKSYEYKKVFWILEYFLSLCSDTVELIRKIQRHAKGPGSRNNAGGGSVWNAFLGQFTAAEKLWDYRGGLHEAYRAAADPSCTRKHESSTLSAANWLLRMVPCPQLENACFSWNWRHLLKNNSWVHSLDLSLESRKTLATSDLHKAHSPLLNFQ